MAKPKDSLLIIEGISPTIEADLQEAIQNIRSAGVPCEFKYRTPQPVNFLEWLVPAAITIFVADKYFGAMFGEMGKDHYKLLKDGLKALYKSALGKKPPVTRVLRQVDGTVREDKVFSGNISFAYMSPEGWRVKLLFPLDISIGDYQRSCLEFSRMLEDHRKNEEDSALGMEIKAQAQEKRDLLPSAYVPAEFPASELRQSVSMLVFWNRTSEQMHVADPMATARAGSLISWPLGRRV